MVGNPESTSSASTRSEVRRPARSDDFAFLAARLGEAAFWRPDTPTPTGVEVMEDPRYAKYLEGWPRPGDYGLIAELDEPVGAAWYRTYSRASHGHGFVGEDVPELAIAVIAARRNQGIGRRLLLDLIGASVAQGFRALSLSVNEHNPARSLYESLGFVLIEQHGKTCVMVRDAGKRVDRDSVRRPTSAPSAPFTSTAH